MIEKVIAYITSGDRLLVFRHTQHPEAGIQVPAGTVEGGELPEEAVLREAHEETGLDNLVIRSYLGFREYDFTTHGEVEIHRWHFYHLEFKGDAPIRWRHYERHPSNGSSNPIEFELFWVRVPDQIPELVPHQGDLLFYIKEKIK